MDVSFAPTGASLIVAAPRGDRRDGRVEILRSPRALTRSRRPPTRNDALARVHTWCDTRRPVSLLLKRLLVLLGLACGAALALMLAAKSPANRSGGRALGQGRPIDREDALALAASPAPDGVGDRAMDHCRALVAFGPRYFGRPGWSQQLDYIVDELERSGVSTERDTWTDRRELITFSNVIATIPGRRPERVVLACHHDTKCTTGHPIDAHNFHFIGANDGASGVGLLLAIAPLLAKRDNEATIQLVFFDGEESLDFDWNVDRALFGSKRFVRRDVDARRSGAAAPIAAVILLDMVGRADMQIQEELYSSPQLRRICWSAAVATGHAESFFQVAEAATDDHVPFLEAGIPAVDLIDLKQNPYWHTARDTLEVMAPASLQTTADVVLTMLPAIESGLVGAPR